MGEQRTSEATMFAIIIFLVLGVIVLLAAAGRIWLDATPSDSSNIDSAAANNVGATISLRHMPSGKDITA